jgi:flagellar motor switch protein FliG
MPSPKGGVTLEDLSGRQKAAALLMLLGSDEAARVMSHLNESEVESLAAEIARFRGMPEEALQGLLGEFNAISSAMGNLLQGGPEVAREALDARPRRVLA